ncbi:unnamed protein product [Bursaphelenchus okinawaensis]|uniref:Uncharacterized protein n=1 Tax=Bursaphelenchus okinawaensis TaxID=465554 RepID=A0A811L9M8_9BILA|nr:unnamed protein product [Bursaphelenchus okinawaensis]CAG9119019.1 unnamed protein product [Bursaphelenchus okinawaensis]
MRYKVWISAFLYVVVAQNDTTVSTASTPLTFPLSTLSTITPVMSSLSTVVSDSSSNATKSHSSFAACANTTQFNGTSQDWNPDIADVKALLCYTGVEQKDNYKSYEDCYKDISYCDMRYLFTQVKDACNDNDYTFNLRRWWFWLLVIGVPIIVLILIIISVISLVYFCCCRPSSYASYDNKIYSVDAAPPIPVTYGNRAFSSTY